MKRSNPKQSSNSHSRAGIGSTQSDRTRHLVFTDDCEDAENQPPSNNIYNTKTDLEKDVIRASAARGIEVMKLNGRMTYGWYPREMKRIKKEGGGLMNITEEDLRNRVRAMIEKEKAEKKRANKSTTTPSDEPLTSLTLVPIPSIAQTTTFSLIQGSDSIICNTTADVSTSTVETSIMATNVDNEAASAADSDETQTTVIPAGRNNGGRPKGSTKEKKRQDKIQLSKAKNWICANYHASRLQNNGTVPKGYKAQLGKEAVEIFQLPCATFDMPLSTIQHRINKGSFNVWHHGPKSPVLSLEVILNSIIISAWEINNPLTVNECKRVANHLVEGSPTACNIIQFRMKHSIYDPNKPLLGEKWWKLYRRRNAEMIACKVGRKFANQRAQNCTYHSVKRMYDTFENGLVQSGNAKYVAAPYFVNINGDIVSDESQAFGHRVTIEYTRPRNIFFTDETGSSTCEMGDGRNGGEKFATPIGETPRREASTRGHHFTVIPITRLEGELVIVAIIFSGEKMKPEWAMGYDIFAKWHGEDHEIELNKGPGKFFPMGPTCLVDGKEIACYCDCSESGSVTGPILTRILSRLDAEGLTERGIDENGKPYYPALILDGHASRMTLPFLKHVTTDNTRWRAMLVCPYGTSKTQFHDHEKQNASFKCKLSEEKRKLVAKHREIGLPSDLYVEEIAVITKAATDATYARVEYAKDTFRVMGYLPFSRAVLDDPEILSSASPEIQSERGEILKIRKEKQNLPVTSRYLRVAPNQIDLTAVGSGRLIGPNASSEIVEAALSLNTGSGTSGSILNVIERGRMASNARRDMNESRSSEHTAKIDRMKKAKRLTAGVVFHSGGGELCTDVYNEVKRRFDNRMKNEGKIKAKKKKVMAELQQQVFSIKQIMQRPKFKFTDLNVKQLKAMCRWRKAQNDDPLPSRKADLIARLKKTMQNPSPNVSPCNSVADESDVDDADSLDSDATAPENDDIILGEDVNDRDDADAEAVEEDEDNNRDDEEEIYPSDFDE